MGVTTIAHSILCIIFTTCCHGNQFDPHLFPSRGPFFEGWYARLIDPANPVTSVGFLFGKVLPKSGDFSPGSLKFSNASRKSHFESQAAHELISKFHIKEEEDERGVKEEEDNASEFQSRKYYYGSERNRRHTDGSLDDQQGDLPLVVASVLVQDRSTSQQLQVFTSQFPVKDYSVRVRGKPVKHNPDDKSPPDFIVQLGNNGSFTATSDETVVNVTIGNIQLYIQASEPRPWGPGGEGPEGWLEHLPLPLHWFVYSLGSVVSAYKMVNLDTGRVLEGFSGRLHLEKNWGVSFPPAWVWMQALNSEGVVVALSGGIVGFETIDINVTAFLVGYKNPTKNIALNFTPANSVTSFCHDGCVGFVNVNVTSLSHRLVIMAASLPPSMSDCILGPEKDGFRPAFLETYDAVVRVTIYQRDDFHFRQTDAVDMRDAGLKLGGDYVCRRKCASDK